MTEYHTIAGTEPSEDGTHQARTIQRTNDDGSIYLMTEIEDGLFVQWSTCAKCQQHVTNCSCKTGPQMADFMKRWRDQRFESSIKGRRYAKLADRASAKDIQDLMKATQKAQDAKCGDSNDSEIEFLRDALEEALVILGLSLPEGRDPDRDDQATPLEDEGEDEDEDARDHAETLPGQPEYDESYARKVEEYDVERGALDPSEGEYASDTRQNVAKQQEEDPNDVGF